MGERLAKRVLLLGWDGADWQIIRSLLDAGQMPNLQLLIERGVMGNLGTLEPILSPLLWTSVATGKRADRHGVHGFVEPRPDGSGIRPVARTSLQAAPLWEILGRHGLQSAVVGWYATHPASPRDGLVVSNLFAEPSGPDPASWPLTPGAVGPEALSEKLRDLRVHPREVTPEQILYFVPEAARAAAADDGRLAKLAGVLAGAGSVHAAGTWIAEHEPWDLLAVYYEMIDRVCHEFMALRAPKMDHVGDEEFETYREVVDATYRFHDLMLGRYMRLVGPETTILLISDHGFFSDHRRPHQPGAGGWEAPLQWHRPFGIFVACGPGIRRDELVFGATLLDVAPTVLTLLGLPAARDMEGHTLARMFESPPAIETVETYGASDPGLSGAEVAEDDPWAAQEAIKQLVALGYVEAPDAEAAKAIEAATAQRLHNLAEVYIAKGDLRAAMPLLEELIALRPRHIVGRRRLAMCRLYTGDVDGCRQLIQALVDEFLDGKTEAPVVQLAYGMIAFREERWEEALGHLLRAEEGLPGWPHVASRIGMVYLRQQRWSDAEAAFRRSLDVDGDHIRGYNGLGRALHHLGRYEEAAEQLLRSIGLRFHQPVAHFELGAALAASGQLAAAIQSLERAIEFAPDLRHAHELLGRIHRTRGNLPRALHHIGRAKELERLEPAGAARA